jgi:hypothetical protein
MELEPDDEGDEAESEPSLGSFDQRQTKARHGLKDRSTFGASTIWRRTTPTPSRPLGASVCMPIAIRKIGQWAIEANREDDGGEPDECGEPSLGSLDRVMNQERSWYRENPCSIDGELDRTCD